MATLTERLDSRETYTGPYAQVVLHYTLKGLTDDSAVKALLFSSTPAYYDGLVRYEIGFRPIHVDTVNDEGVWDCVVRYVAQQVDPQFSFEIGAQTERVTQSAMTVHSYPDPGAPDHKGAINVINDGGSLRAEGADIQVPTYNWSETWYLDDNVVTPTYRTTLYKLVGRYNDRSWKGWKAGEVLFLGASGSRQGTGLWAITFRFAAQPNVEASDGLYIGGFGPIEKKGWEYLWVYRGEQVVEGAIVTVPRGVYVERVVLPGDFSALGF